MMMRRKDDVNMREHDLPGGLLLDESGRVRAASENHCSAFLVANYFFASDQFSREATLRA
jgi:hypothetical protein